MAQVTSWAVAVTQAFCSEFYSWWCFFSLNALLNLWLYYIANRCCVLLLVLQDLIVSNTHRWRPYRVECTGSLPTSEVKRRRTRLVLGWGTAREDLRVLPAFSLSIRLLTYTPDVHKHARLHPTPICIGFQFVLGSHSEPLDAFYYVLSLSTKTLRIKP